MLISLNLRPNAKMSPKRKITPKKISQHVTKPIRETKESNAGKGKSPSIIRRLTTSEIESLRKDSQDAVREIRRLRGKHDC
jgi:hypothetical protein